MYNITELKIIEQVYLKPGIHKRELAKQIGLGMPSIDYSLKKIDRVIKMYRSGNQIKYLLNYSEEALVPLLYAVEFLRFERLPMKIKISAREFIEELREKPLLAIIFGSYAKGNYHKESDIDILLVFQQIRNGNDIENTANKIGMRTNTKISPVYLDYASFRESFHNSTKEFFKNLKENKIILIGIEYWRQLKNEES